jgi:hypothetical protein
MSVEENKAVVLRYFLETHNPPYTLDVIDETCTPAYAKRRWSWLRIERTAFPDASYTIDDVIAEGDKVVLRVSFNREDGRRIYRRRRTRRPGRLLPAPSRLPCAPASAPGPVLSWSAACGSRPPTRNSAWPRPRSTNWAKAAMRRRIRVKEHGGEHE